MTKYEQGFIEGKAAGYTSGFNAGFWSAILLISAVVVAGFISMRALNL